MPTVVGPSGRFNCVLKILEIYTQVMSFISYCSLNFSVYFCLYCTCFKKMHACDFGLKIN